jgi:hypothetical protein
VSRRAPEIVHVVEPPPPTDSAAAGLVLDEEPRVPRAERLRAIGYSVFLYVVSITVALAIAAIIVLLTHGSPHAVFSALY